MPGAYTCAVSERKVLDYLLNSKHEHGAAKARFFASFGFRTSDWIVFCRALEQHPRTNHLMKIIESEFGRKYLVVCMLATPDGRNPCVHTVWIDDGAGFPRLITAYPKSE